MLPWSTEEEVIARVNQTTSGLGGSVWSQDIERAYRLSGQIEAGGVWINSYAKPIPQGYLGGHKYSGIGGEWGRHGLKAYCNIQVLHHYK